MQFSHAFRCILKVFFSQGLQNSKFRHLFVCKIVLSPQRGRVFHCEHLGFCKGSFCTQCHLQGLAAKTLGFKFVLSPQRGAFFAVSIFCVGRPLVGFLSRGFLLSFVFRALFP